MSRLGRFRLQPNERKRYSIGYDDWLADGETILNAVIVIAPVTVPPLELFASTAYIDPDGKGIFFLVEGGLDGSTYEATVTVTTSDQQIKEDEIVFIVEEQTYAEMSV